MHLTRSYARRFDLEKNRFLLPKEISEKKYFDAYPEDWNRDNFGPYVVPDDHVFVLGDNRSSSLDSRYIGPIPIEDIEDVLL